MKREELSELHFITDITNVPSILRAGILCHRLAAGVPHVSVAKEGVQERRADVRIPSGQKLHDYANLYLTARNPMMYSRKDRHTELCVLRVACDILDLKGTVISDRNAASGSARFSPSPQGLARLDVEVLFARYWNHVDPTTKERLKAAKCAEALVPERVKPEFIRGAFVSCESARVKLNAVAPGLTIEVSADLFFQ